ECSGRPARDQATAGGQRRTCEVHSGCGNHPAAGVVTRRIIGFGDILAAIGPHVDALADIEQRSARLQRLRPHRVRSGTAGGPVPGGTGGGGRPSGAEVAQILQITQGERREKGL
ncbi:MAG: hypothetical protein AVDCRST_MAG43-2231, partial [uncultured Thermomicrobiales bacterium]